MTRLSFIATLLGSVAAVSAATQSVTAQTVVSLLMPYGNPAHIYGSIIQADSEKTTYSLDCGTDHCYQNNHVDYITQGPSTWALAHYWTEAGTTG